MAKKIIEQKITTSVTHDEYIRLAGGKVLQVVIDGKIEVEFVVPMDKTLVGAISLRGNLE